MSESCRTPYAKTFFIGVKHVSHRIYHLARFECTGCGVRTPVAVRPSPRPPAEGSPPHPALCAHPPLTPPPSPDPGAAPLLPVSGALAPPGASRKHITQQEALCPCHQAFVLRGHPCDSTCQNVHPFRGCPACRPQSPLRAAPGSPRLWLLCVALL